MASSCWRSPYQAILGDAFDTLDSEVQKAHLAPLVASGRVNVEHGSHWFTPLLVRVLKLPAAGRNVPVSLSVLAAGDGVAWERRFASRTSRTRQSAAGRHLIERTGLGRVAFTVDIDGRALRYEQVSFSVAGVQMPAILAPIVAARVDPTPGGWRVSVAVTWRSQLVCRYAGTMAAS